MATQIATAGYAASTWVPRGDGRAYMPVVVSVQGDTETVVEDVAAELRRRLSWGSTETVIAIPAGPTGALMSEEAPVGSLVVALDVNQGAPEYGDGDAEPGFSRVRLTLTQVLSRNLDDLPLLMARRRDLRREVHTLDGHTLGA
jgi:hypothetical protein